MASICFRALTLLAHAIPSANRVLLADFRRPVWPCGEALRQAEFAQQREGASVTVTQLPWTWNASVHVATAPGIHVFRNGAEYAHDGISPQECLVPELVVNPPALARRVSIVSLEWDRFRLRVRADGGDGLPANLRLGNDGEGPSIAERPRELGADGQISLLVPADTLVGRQALAELRDAGGQVVATRATVVGGSAMESDELDRQSADAFHGLIVRKDLVRQFRGQFPVPTYVVEFMLGRYCATTDEREIADGLDVVRNHLSSRTVRAGEGELIKSRSRETGAARVIDIITARLDPRSDSYLATLSSLCPHDVRIGVELVRDNERMLTGGFCAEVNLGYGERANSWGPDATGSPGPHSEGVRHGEAGVAGEADHRT